jgi:hypothetical protein
VCVCVCVCVCVSVSVSVLHLWAGDTFYIEEPEKKFLRR